MSDVYEIGAAYDDAEQFLGDYEIGAPRLMRRARALPSRVTRKTPGSGGPLKEIPLGIDSVSTVAAAATVTITERPQLPMRPDRFVVADSIAAYFLISDLKIGNASQFASSAAVPAEVFKATAVGVSLKMATAQTAQDVVVEATNIDAAAHRFYAAVIGPALS